ncbi:MAG: transglutaminase-like domain-containing protein [Planctomycetota bacterium]|jgi:hypothetical protein
MRVRYIFIICLILEFNAAADFNRDKTEYFAVFMEGKKVGYAIYSRAVCEDKVTTTQQANMTITRMGIPITLNTIETCVETIEGKPLKFESVQDISLMKLIVSGKVDKKGIVTATTSSIPGVEKTFPWPEGALMPEGLHLVQLKHGLKKGTEYKVKTFIASETKALDTSIRIGEKQNVDLLGRVVPLTKVVVTQSIPGAGEVTSISYVNNEFLEQKSITSIIGINLELIACSKEFALSENDVYDFYKRMLLPSPQVLENPDLVESITYYLSPIEGANTLMIPSDDNQKVKHDRLGRAIVTVRPIKTPRGVIFPYKGNDKEILDALKPTRYLQSDNKEIVAIAKKAVGDTKDTVEAAKGIEEFVAEYIQNKNLSVGYASAGEVVESRQGDCSEFAVLTTAMCRAVGIPAKVVMGVAYINQPGLENVFAGHAWTQVYAGGKWLCIDASFKSSGLGGYDAGHIALAAGDGDSEDFFKLIGIMGQFRIDAITCKKGY